MILVLAVVARSIRNVVANNMAIIKKKIWPEYFDAVASGKKKYELRLNDFNIKEGDTLILEERDPETEEYTGRTAERKVTYVGCFKIDQLFWPKEEIKKKGIQIISLE
jgi:ASC-1-like (ASCH) protein